MQGVDETLNLTNLGLENYVKESREEFLAVVRSVDINLIEPIRQTAIVGKKQKKGKEQFIGRRNVPWPVCMTY